MDHEKSIEGENWEFQYKDLQMKGTACLQAVQLSATCS